MTHPVTIRPEAQRDIEEAAFWYEIQRPGLGDQFIFQVDSLLQRIEKRPLQYDGRLPGGTCPTRNSREVPCGPAEPVNNFETLTVNI